jgi:3-dehydroquinate dehydratase-2
MKLKVINGPNINMLGIREPGIYGKDNFATLCQTVKDFAAQKNIEVELYQSNHEGDLVDVIQECFGKIDGIVINPGAYTHTSIALLDAVKSVSIPTVEVHISKVEEREDFRQISYIRLACVKTITGHGIAGYTEAMNFLIDYINGNNTGNTNTGSCKGANHAD